MAADTATFGRLLVVLLAVAAMAAGFSEPGGQVEGELLAATVPEVLINRFIRRCAIQRV